MKKIYSVLMLCAILIGFSSTVKAQSTIASWDFTLDETTDPVTVSSGATGNISVDNYGTHPLVSTATEANITITPLTKGQGLLDAIAANPIPPTSASPKWIYAAWGALGFDVTIADGTDTSTWGDEEWVDARIAEDKYFTFSVTPDAGYKVSYTQIPAHMIRSLDSNSPVCVCYQYKIEGKNDYVTIATKTLGTSNSGGREVAGWDLSSITDLQEQSKKVTFRIVFYNKNATGTGAAGFYRSTLSVTGTVSEDISSQLDVIAYWDFTSATGAANTANFGTNALAPTANTNAVTIGNLTRSDAIDATTTGTTSVWGVKNLSSTNITTIPIGADNFPDKYTDMVNDKKYITFSITPNAGTTLSLSGIDAFTARASASTVRMRMEYKIGDGEFTVFGIRTGDSTEDLSLSNSSSGVATKEINFSEVTALQDVVEGTTITFRIVYIMNVNATATAEAAWAGFYNTNFVIRGTVTSTGITEVSIPSAGITTFSSATPVTIDEAVKVYTVNSTKDNSAILTEFTGTIPANEGVVLKGEPGTYAITRSEETPSAIENNLLVGCPTGNQVADTDTDFTYYILSLNSNSEEGSAGFYFFNEEGVGGFPVPAGKAYLKVSKGSNPAPAKFALSFGGGSVTNIDAISQDDNAPVNVYSIDGCLLRSNISPAEALQGLAKGIYLVGGKKIAIY